MFSYPVITSDAYTTYRGHGQHISLLSSVSVPNSYPILGQHGPCSTEQFQFVVDTRRNIITNCPIPANFRSVLWIFKCNSMIPKTWYPYFQFVLKHGIFKWTKVSSNIYSLSCNSTYLPTSFDLKKLHWGVMVKLWQHQFWRCNYTPEVHYKIYDYYL